MRNFIRLYLIAIAQILLLCSCTITTPSDRSSSLSQNESPKRISRASSNKPAADKEFSEHHEITSTKSIQKDGLLISYSLRAIPNKKGILIRLSLVFRNLQDRSRIVMPKVLLMDASGKKISAYTKTGFIKFSSSLAEKTSDNASKSLTKKDRDGRNFAKSRTQWANTNWLKESYKIPPQGIVIGELVYHSNRLNLPMKLTVNSDKQEFVFTTPSSLPVEDK